jgi:hypothetical protein
MEKVTEKRTEIKEVRVPETERWNFQVLAQNCIPRDELHVTDYQKRSSKHKFFTK